MISVGSKVGTIKSESDCTQLSAVMLLSCCEVGSCGQNIYAERLFSQELQGLWLLAVLPSLKKAHVHHPSVYLFDVSTKPIVCHLCWCQYFEVLNQENLSQTHVPEPDNEIKRSCTMLPCEACRITNPMPPSCLANSPLDKYPRYPTHPTRC